MNDIRCYVHKMWDLQTDNFSVSHLYASVLPKFYYYYRINTSLYTLTENERFK